MDKKNFKFVKDGLFILPILKTDIYRTFIVQDQISETHLTYKYLSIIGCHSGAIFSKWGMIEMSSKDQRVWKYL